MDEAVSPARFRTARTFHMGNSGGDGARTTVSLTLGHPEATFLYRTTKPVVRLDGTVVPQASGWGQHTLPVTPGSHQIEVWVPYILPRRAGRARLDLVVGQGEEIDLEYVAPTITFAKGSLGTPGEQKSTGYSAVMTMNIVAVVVVVVLCGVLALTS
ncbi:hypothetical protein [Micromonospora sp. NBC_01412]|uniref:hypothetical protein n=1 Tax=Micromonospora sp. NBC_01412 TaxID=2903590 RepID=UPI00324FE83A